MKRSRSQHEKSIENGAGVAEDPEGIATAAATEGSKDADENDDILEMEPCWKCRGSGFKKTTKTTPLTCPVCQGSGKRPASKRSGELTNQPGRIVELRGRRSSNGVATFAGVPAAEGYKLLQEDTKKALVQKGEIMASLGCGDWRIFQLASGHKLTVDDFLCAWYTAKEVRRRGYGVQDGTMFGQVPTVESPKIFHHADIGCGCGSVLMTLLWGFPRSIRSHGVEAQAVSFDLCRRGLQFNVGEDGSQESHTAQLIHEDLRDWDGGGLAPYDVITGTPPYFPKDRFVASQNHAQKIRCRVPTRGAAADYVGAASRLIKSEGIICIAETARKEGEEAMLGAIQEHGLTVLKRLDVITRTGLPPRFSCWLLTTQEESIDDTIQQSPSSFMIETLTIRDANQNRTLEYVAAMESMGWVDFEETRSKTLPKDFSTAAEHP